MKWMVLCLLLATGVALADPATDAETRQLQTQLAQIQQEQQAVFQQFQMLQELRRSERQAENPEVIHNSPVYSSDNPPPNYDDLVREKLAREERIDQYTTDLDNLFARYRVLEEQRKGVLERLRQLSQPQ